jgi:hypothetical protein
MGELKPGGEKKLQLRGNIVDFLRLLRHHGVQKTSPTIEQAVLV